MTIQKSTKKCLVFSMSKELLLRQKRRSIWYSGDRKS